MSTFTPEAFILKNQLVVSDTTDATNGTSGGLVITGGGSVSKSFIVLGDQSIGGQASINNVNVTPNLNDIILEKQATLSADVNSFTNINGFYFLDSIASAFKAYVTVVVTGPTNKYAFWELNGVYTPNGWMYTSTFTGDRTGVNFTITDSSGTAQVQYTNSNGAGYTTIIRYRAQTTAPPGTSPSGGTGLFNSTSNNYIANSLIFANTTETVASVSDITFESNVLNVGGASRLLVSNTTDASSLTSASLVVRGGASVAKKLLVGEKIGIGTNAPGYPLDIVGNINIQGDIYQNGAVYTGTSVLKANTNNDFYLNPTSAKLGIATTNPSATLDVSGSINSSSLVSGSVTSTSGNITSLYAASMSSGNIKTTNITSENSILTNVTVSNMMLTNLSLSNVTSTNVLTTNITSGSVISTNVLSTNASSTNVVSTNITSGSVISTNVSVTNASSTNVVASNITSGSVVSTNVSVTSGTIGSFVGTNTSVTNASVGSVIGTNSLFTNSTLSNILSTNVSSGSISASNINSTSNTFGNVVNTSITSGSVKATDVDASNITSTNIVATHISSGTLTLSSSANILLISAGTLNATSISSGNASLINITSSSILTTSLSSTNISSSSLNASSITTNSVVTTNVSATNNTSTNVVSTNISSGTILTTNVSSTNSSSGSVNATNINVTNLTAGSISISNISTTNITSSSILSTNLSSTSMSSNNLISTSATLGSVTISSSNMSSANIATSSITAGSMLSTNHVATNLTSSNINASSLNATNVVFTNSTISGHLLPSADVTHDLGSASRRWRDLYLSGNTIYLGDSVVISATTSGSISFTTTPDAVSSFSVISSNNIKTSSLTSGSIVSTNISTTNISASTLNVSGGLTTGNINFTGTLSQNGSPYVSSQWTSTNGNLFYTAGNIGIFNPAPSTALDVSGGANITGTVSAGTLVSSLVSAASIGASGATVGTLYNTNIINTGITTSTLNASNVASSTLTASNIVSSNITVGGINISNMNISSNLTVGNDLLVKGSVISVNVTTLNIINNNVSTGTLNASNATIGTLASTLITSASLGASGITVGTLYASTVTGANAQLSGTISAATHVGSLFSSASLGASGITVGTLYNSNGLLATFNSNTIGNIFTTGGNVGINMTSPAYTLDVNGTIDATSFTGTNLSISNITTSSLFILSTGANTNSILITSGYIGIGTTTPSTNLHIRNYVGNPLAAPLTPDFLTLTAHVADVTTTNIGGGAINMEIGESTGGNTATFSAAKIVWGAEQTLYGSGFENNSVVFFRIQTADAGVLENVFTLTGNRRVGINTTNPSYMMSMHGSAANIAGPHTSVHLNNDTTFPLFQQLNWDRDNIALGFDMYYGSGNWRVGSTTGSFRIHKNQGRLNFDFHNSTSSTQGLLITPSTALCINTAGNVGIRTTAPSTTFEVSGSSLISGTISAGTLVGSLVSAASLGASGITVGTLYASTITGANAQLSGTVSAGTLVGSLVSAASLGASGITVGTLRSSVVTSASVSAVSITTGSLYVLGSSANVSGPHTTVFLNTDTTYPVFQQLNWDRDNIALGFDMYYGSGNWRIASTAGSFRINKNQGRLNFDWHNPTTIGNIISPGTALCINTSGNIGIRTTAPSTTFEVSGGVLISGTISTGTLVGSLVSTASLGASGVTVGTLYATTITGANIQLSGTISAGNIATSSFNPSNINTTNITTSSCIVSNTLRATFNSNTLGNIFTTGGNVGIGTTAPTVSFDVSSLMSLSSTRGTFIGLNSINGDFGTIECYTTGNTVKLPLCLNPYGGAVGIGTTSPSTTFDVRSQMNVSSTRGTFINFSSINGNFGTIECFSTGNTVKLPLCLNPYGGAVGIGTINPSATLEISSTNTFGNLFLGNNIQSRKLVLYSAAVNNSDFTGFGLDGTGGLRYNTPTGGSHNFYAGEESIASMTRDSLILGFQRTTGNYVVGVRQGGYVKFNYNQTSPLLDANSGVIGGNIFGTNALEIVGYGQILTPRVVNIYDNLVVSGSVSKASGTFDIKHPIQEKANQGHRLVHSFIEGPRCDLIYRGTVQLVNGTATVDINTECVAENDCVMSPGTFEALVANPQYFLQNTQTFDRLKGEIVGSNLTITCEDPTSNIVVSWMVVGERKDPYIKEWDKTNVNGYLKTEYQTTSGNNIIV